METWLIPYDTLCQDMELEYGPFVLFGLVLYADQPSEWHLVAASRKLPEGEAGIDILADYYGKHFNAFEQPLLGRLVVLPVNHRLVQALQNIVGVKSPAGYWHGENLRIMDMDVLQMHLLRWQPENVANAIAVSRYPLLPGQHVGN